MNIGTIRVLLQGKNWIFGIIHCMYDKNSDFLNVREVLKNLRLRISAIVGNELSSADEQQALGIAVLVLGIGKPL